MKRSIIPIVTILILIFCSSALAEVKTFIKEYTYQASEIDNRESCRAIALGIVKRQLLEELGTYVESVTDVTNYQLTKDKITVLTAGIVQTNIIDEKWDGRYYWLKARIIADADDVNKKIGQLRNDRRKEAELEQIAKKAEDALKEIEKLKKELQIAKTDKRGIELLYVEAVKQLTAAEWAEKAFRYAANGMLKDALNAYTKTIQLDPKFHLAYSSRGMIHAMLGNHRQAIADFNKAIELKPAFLGYYLNRGNSHTALGNEKMAVKDFSFLIKRIKPISAFDYSDLGIAYAGLGKYEEALRNYSDAITINPKLGIIYGHRGFLYLKLRDYRRAINDISKAIELDPDLSYQLVINRGNAYVEIGDNKQALADFNEAIRNQPEYAMAFAARGIYYARLGMEKRAVEDFDKAEELQPDFAPTFMFRGFLYSEAGNFRKALDDSNKAIELWPEYALGYVIKGKAYIGLNDYKQAVLNFSKAIELDPNNQSIYNLVGSAYLQSGRADKAIAVFEKSVELNSNDPVAHNNRGLAYFDLGKYKFAIDDFNSAISLEKNEQLHADSYLGLAICYFQQNKRKEAKLYYQKALSIKGSSQIERETKYYSEKQKKVLGLLANEK